MNTGASGERSGVGADAGVEAGLGDQVRTTVGRLYRRFRSERPEGALGDAALDVLVWLSKRGPQTLTQLSERAHVAPASMSQSVNRLASAGYAARTSDPSDRRKVLIGATAQGAELAHTTRIQRQAWLDARLRILDAEDRSTIARACVLLRTIADS